jgi:hypothetical protein
MHAVDDLLVVAGSREAADRTGSTVHDIGDRAYDESTPIRYSELDAYSLLID